MEGLRQRLTASHLRSRRVHPIALAAERVANSEAIAEIDVVELGVEVGLIVLQVCHEFLGCRARRDRDGGARQSACAGSEDDVGAGGVVGGTVSSLRLDETSRSR
jgi:hypothetical protein